MTRVVWGGAVHPESDTLIMMRILNIIFLTPLCLFLHVVLSAMSKKRTREHSSSPKFRRVAWAEKRTRRGAVFTAEVIDTPASLETPVKPKKHATLQRVKYSQDQTPISGEGIETAMSLPPIPAPEILAPKRNRRGKVWNIYPSWLQTKKYVQTQNNLLSDWIPLRESFIHEYLNQECLPDNHLCKRYMTRVGQFRCLDCFGQGVFCHSCCLEVHSSLPFHSIEKWTGVLQKNLFAYRGVYPAPWPWRIMLSSKCHLPSYRVWDSWRWGKRWGWWSITGGMGTKRYKDIGDHWCVRGLSADCQLVLLSRCPWPWNPTLSTPPLPCFNLSAINCFYLCSPWVLSCGCCWVQDFSI